MYLSKIRQEAFEDELRKIADTAMGTMIDNEEEETPAPPFNPMNPRPASGIKTINKV